MITKRGQTFWYDTTSAGRRIRVSLSTRDKAAAERLGNRIGFAMADGPHSPVWESLRFTLPQSSFKSLTANLNLPSAPDITEFEKSFFARLDRRVKLGEITQSTCDLYSKTAEVFFSWCLENGIKSLSGMAASMVEGYLVQRKAGIVAKGGSGRGLSTDFKVLAAIFNFALEENIIRQSPLKGKYKADSDPEGAEPFTPEEMSQLAANVDDSNRLAFLLLRHTGMRGSDIAEVTWESINWTAATLHWQTKKRKTWVTIPLVTELKEELSREFSKRDTRGYPEDPILSNTTRAKLYKMMSDLGKKAGVENVYPHRFRDSRAVSILAAGGTIYDVARVLGVTISTADTHYTEFTEQLQDRVRSLLESSGQHEEAMVA